MYAPLILSALLTVAAPVPEFKLTPAEEAALKELEPFGFEIQDHGFYGCPHGATLQYNGNGHYDQKLKQSIRPIAPSAKDLAPLAKLRRLRKLNLQAAPIHDSTLGLLCDMDRLDSLELRKTRIGDEGVKKLVGLKRLRFLDLSETVVTDASLKMLAVHPTLEYLTLRETLVTNEGLKALAKNERLSNLDVWGCKGVTDASLASLAKMPNLTQLGLHVTDKGLALMAKRGTFPKLGWLILAESVTDEQLKILHDPKVLPSLKRVSIAKDRITDKAIHALTKARPGLEIWNPKPPWSR